MKFSIGIVDVAVLTFIVLKLTGVIAWSWWWIFSPYIAVGTIIVLLLLLVGVLVVADEMKKDD